MHTKTEKANAMIQPIAPINNRKPYNNEAGYIASRHNNINNGWVVIYKAAEAGIETGGKVYAAVCKTHGTVGAATSLPNARPWLKRPDFCAACMAGLDLPAASAAVEQPTAAASTELTATSIDGDDYDVTTDVTKHSGYIMHQGLATIYDSVAQGIDYRTPRKFSVVCEPHGHFKGTNDIEQARELLTNTAAFCPHCKKLAKAKKND